ncbi:MAG: hypothetical protein U0Q15_03475 [Kineosporiaceae bacterium]
MTPHPAPQVEDPPVLHPTDTSGRLSAETLRAGDGREVFVCTTEPEDGACVGDVVLVPPYGMAVPDLFLPAHHLAHNGFRVTRFDARDSVGRSAGQIADYRLSGVRADTELVLDRLSGRTASVVLVGLSLSAPVVWRVAATSPLVAGAATLVPVVDVPATLEAVTGDSVQRYRDGDPTAPRWQRIFGHDIDAAPFIADMDTEGHRDLAATAALLATVEVPVLAVAADGDEYVVLDDVREVASACRAPFELTVVRGSSHEIGRSMRATRQAMAEVSRFCLATVGATRDVREPALAEVIAASERENRDLQAYAQAQTSGGQQ